MSDLWIYGRRPSGAVRNRHGGFNASFPMNDHTVLEQAGLTRERDAAAAREAAERDRRPRQDGHEAQNVLNFRDRASRAGRGSSGPSRPGKRPGPYRD